MLDKHNVYTFIGNILFIKELSMKFLNRELEKKLLESELAKNSSRFIVLYGRRRIGKSALLTHILDESTIYYLADINESEIQRRFFANQIATLIPNFDKLTYPDWNTFFEQINQQLRKKITIVIDEFPYLAKSSPELPSVIQKIIDLKINSNFNLILCGSSQQMMYGLVLDKTAPLFGRAHRIINLKPMEPRWLKKALNIDSTKTVEEYSVWGGVPRNWELRSEYNSLQEAIKELILDPYGVLHEEPLRLFMDDLKNAVQPISIASLIGQGANKLSEIASRLNKPATNLHRPLQNMIETGYLKKDICWGEKYNNSKKTHYKIHDPISRFYFTFVVPNQSKLNSNMIESVEREVADKWRIYVSETWEELCRESVSKLQVNEVSFLPAQRWWSQSKALKSNEIDIITESTDGKCLLIGEAKWQTKISPEKVLEELEQKITNLKLTKNYSIIYKLIMMPEIKERTDGDILYRNADFICS